MHRRAFFSILLSVFCFLSVPFALAAETYFCPMKCEGEKTYTAPGTCPVCGMDLVKTGSAGAATMAPPEYRVDFTVEPKMLQAGAEASLVLSPKKTKDGAIVKELEVVHEKPMHLIAVSQDLSWYAHWHPEKQVDGTLKTSVLFPNGGNYLLYADFTPKGVENQVVPLAVQVEGKKLPPVKLKENKKTKKVDGYEVAFAIDSAPKSGGANELKFTVKKGKTVVSDLEKHLGALGHVVIVSEDTTRYVHVHPASNGFHTAFPKAGLFKVWYEFKHGGKVRHVDYVVRVR